MKNDPAFPNQYTERVEIEGDHPMMSGFVDRLVVNPGLTKRELAAMLIAAGAPGGMKPEDVAKDQPDA